MDKAQEIRDTVERNRKTVADRHARMVEAIDSGKKVDLDIMRAMWERRVTLEYVLDEIDAILAKDVTT
jgi:hypothetical protein